MLAASPTPTAPPTATTEPTPTPTPTATPIPTAVARVDLPVVDCAMDGPGAMSEIAPLTYAVEIPQDLQFEISAYWDGGAAYLAPAGWDCTGDVGQNGSEILTIRNPDARKQGVVYDLPGISHEAVLDLACPVFPDARRAHQREYGFACTIEKVPSTTTIDRLSATAAMFADAPGTPGVGTGSGKGLATIGAVVFLSQTAAKVSCTAPDARARACEAIAHAFVAQFK